MIQADAPSSSFLEAHKDFLETIQQAIKVGVTINLPSGLSPEPEVVTRYDTIEQEMLSRFPEAKTTVKYPGILMQFLFPIQECLVTVVQVQQEDQTQRFDISIIKLDPQHF